MVCRTLDTLCSQVTLHYVPFSYQDRNIHGVVGWRLDKARKPGLHAACVVGSTRTSNLRRRIQRRVSSILLPHGRQPFILAKFRTERCEDLTWGQKGIGNLVLHEGIRLSKYDHFAYVDKNDMFLNVRKI